MDWSDDGWMGRNMLPDVLIYNKIICCVPTEYNNNNFIFLLNWYGRADVSALFSRGAVPILGSGYFHLTLLAFLIQTRVVFVAFITGFLIVVGMAIYEAYVFFDTG
jgi:hypothetical protein